MNTRRHNRRHIRERASGQAAWLIITILTFFLFIGTLFIVYKEMDFYKTSRMWPQSNATDFMGKVSGFFNHRTGDVQPYVPIKSTKPDAGPIVPVIIDGADGDGTDGDGTDGDETNATEAVEEPIAVP